MQRLVLVVGTMALVLLGALAGQLRAAWARRRGAARSTFERRLTGTLTAAVGVGVTCFLYGALIEADWLEVTVEVVEVPTFEPGHHLTLALLSDLHVDGDSRALWMLERQLERLKPDLLVFTGDAINEGEALPVLRKVLKAGAAPQGRFAVRGNHDVQPRWASVDLFADAAVELNSATPTFVDNGRLALCGAAFWNWPAAAECLQRVPKGSFPVVAYHSPDWVERAEPRPGLYLAGHTHGGQVRVPFYGAVVTFSDYDKKYEMGRYEVKGTTLYVNRGVGFQPLGPRVRFLARPELTILQLVAPQRQPPGT